MNSPDLKQTVHFLVAVDGSEPSLAALRWVAQTASAGLRVQCTVLAVQHPVMAGEVSALAAASVTIEARAHEAAGILAQASAVLRQAGLPHATQTRVDDPANAVIEQAQALGCDAIVIGRRGHGVLRSALLGSVSAEVVRSASVPVIVVGAVAAVPDTPQSPLRILVALDGSDCALRAADFAALLLSNADSRGQLHLLHVDSTQTLAETIFGQRERVLAHWSAKHAQEALAGPRSHFERQGISFTKHAVSSDDPGQAILQTARDLDCTVVVMGTRGLGPVAGMLLGSVAQHVLAKAALAVALVR